MSFIEDMSRLQRPLGSRVGPYWLLLLLFHSPQHSTSWTVRRRHCRLLPWITDQQSNNDDGTHDDCCLGWTLEEQRRLTPLSKTHICQIQVCNGNAEESSVHFQLPIVPHDDSLATSVWPAGLAAAMLCHQPAMIDLFRNCNNHNCTVLELGAGLGITGLTAAQHASHVQLTDQDTTVIQSMQDMEIPNVQAYNLDWRDIQRQPYDNDNSICGATSSSSVTPVDVVLGSDIAYYYFLLRPLMDTTRAFLKPSGSLFLVVGQANRASQWDLYHNIAEGCYNQLTDERELPWPGKTEMLLFRLQVQEWVLDDDNVDMVGTTRTIGGRMIPIAALRYQSPGFYMERLTGNDYIATQADFEGMEMSF